MCLSIRVCKILTKRLYQISEQIQIVIKRLQTSSLKLIRYTHVAYSAGKPKGSRYGYRSGLESTRNRTFLPNSHRVFIYLTRFKEYNNKSIEVTMVVFFEIQRWYPILNRSESRRRIPNGLFHISSRLIDGTVW